jgi:hypothetical protein
MQGSVSLERQARGDTSAGLGESGAGGTGLSLTKDAPVAMKLAPGVAFRELRVETVTLCLARAVRRGRRSDLGSLTHQFASEFMDSSDRGIKVGTRHSLGGADGDGKHVGVSGKPPQPSRERDLAFRKDSKFALEFLLFHATPLPARTASHARAEPQVLLVAADPSRR